MKRRWMIVGITSMALIGAGVVVRAVHLGKDDHENWRLENERDVSTLRHR